MRLEFLTQDDPLYILPFFDEFLRHYSGDFEILQISCSPTMGKRSRTQLLRELTTLYGLVGMTRVLSEVVISRVRGKSLLDRRAPRFYGMEQIARANGIPLKRIGNPNDIDFIESVRKRKADVLVSVACPYILKNELLRLPPQGCINIHHAPLPRYKGMMPTFWQMFHGETTVGVTIHRMVAKLDEGTALLQDSMAIEPGETLHHLIRRSKRHGAHCMARALKQIAASSSSEVALDQEKGTYFTFPTTDEIREFHRRGFRAI